jgi:hypothetical protein
VTSRGGISRNADHLAEKWRSNQQSGISIQLRRATHDDLHAWVVEVKKMLTALHRNLTADA